MFRTGVVILCLTACFKPEGPGISGEPHPPVYESHFLALMNGTPAAEVEKRLRKPDTISSAADLEVWVYRVMPGEPPGNILTSFRSRAAGGSLVGKVFLRNGVIDHLTLRDESRSR